MAKQIKAYVEVEAYVDVPHGRMADPKSLLSSVFVVDDYGNAMVRLAEATLGSGAPARILSGPHGVGKSTMLSILHALASYPDMRGRATSGQLATVAGYLGGNQVLSVFVDPFEDQSPDLPNAFRDAFMAALTRAVAMGVPADGWSAAASDPQCVERALALIPGNARLILIIDGVSNWLLSADRDAAQRSVDLLSRVGELATQHRFPVLLALDEDHLEGSESIFAPLLRTYQVEYLPVGVLSQACDSFLFKKDSRQRAELNTLFADLKRKLPNFRWTDGDFRQNYPLHPATLEVTSALRHYAPSFSFLRFAATAGNRAKGRRDLSLIVLDETFDACEYELRKNSKLVEGFQIYDDFVNAVIPKLTETQQRFWAKLVLKGLFLYSLARRPVTAQELADAMMLYDESDVESGGRIVATILDAFEQRAAQRFKTEGAGAARRYRLVVAEEHSGMRVLNEIADSFAVDDPRIADVLIGLGASRFPDWPTELGPTPTASELEVPWRGTWRMGVLSYRMPKQLVVIPPIDTGLALEDGDDLLVDLPESLDSATASAAMASAMAPAVDPVSVTFTPAESISELDWEVSIVPLGHQAKPVDGPSTLVCWEPGAASEEDLLVLRRLSALRSDDPRLHAPGVDFEALKAEAEAEGGLIFHRLYLETGRFVGKAWEVNAADQAARETLGGMLARMLDQPLAERYPQHPAFGSELDEAVSRLLIEKFFVGGAPTPNVQQAAAGLAAPLGFADSVERGPYRFNPNSEAVLTMPFNTEPLRLAEAAGDLGVPMQAVYQVLRREPFGLQRPAQRLVIAGLVASGRVKLVGPSGELTADNVADSAVSMDAFTILKRSGLTVYSNEALLDWSRMVTEADYVSDLVTSDGRQLVRRALENWLDRWNELDLAARFSEVPPEAATRRTWQLIAASKQYFDSTARSVQGILSEEISLEEGIGRIVTTFAANPTIYQRAMRDLKMLTSFIEWSPYYALAKEYVLSADKTTEQKIEAERTELLDFISSPHRLLDENKRRRFETVFEAFKTDYIDYFVAAHDLHVGARGDFEALDAYLDSPQWIRFQLLSNVRVVNTRYYQFASELVQSIHDLACDLPTRELLQDRPYCVCSFRLTHTESVSRMFERLRFLVEQGSQNHVLTIRQYRQSILAGLRSMQSDAAYQNASVPLISLLTSSESSTEITPSAVELINRSVSDQDISVLITPPPPVESGHPETKEKLRKRVQQWIEDLPGEDDTLIEIARLVSLPPDVGDE